MHEDTPLRSPGSASFEELRKRANDGNRLRVVFLGGSLTYGANASDPERTSYRAQVMRRLEDRFPQTQFRVWDAAIGGTGSPLAVFRLQRDVLRYEPHLVLLDFTANDDIHGRDAERLASYESLIRRLVGSGAAVVLVIFPFRDEIDDAHEDDLPRRAAHFQLASAYQLPVADVVAAVRKRTAAGELNTADLWPWDGAHPCDKGYTALADAVWETLDNALCRGLVAEMPDQPLYGDSYTYWQRFQLHRSDRPLPSGWERDTPSRTAAWYDGLMSRWLDGVAVARRELQPEPLKLTFKGRSVALFGEETLASGSYTATLDGEALPDEHDASSQRFGGNRQHFQVLATGLDEGVPHDLVITPQFRNSASTELRIESICVAGAHPVSVRLAP